MFLGQIRKPDKAAAYRQLRKHISMVGVWVLAVRAVPYVAHFLSKDKTQELKLEF